MLVVYVTHSWTRAREKRYIDDNDDESKQLVVPIHVPEKLQLCDCILAGESSTTEHN